MADTRTRIFVHTSFEGIHRFENAPEKVRFLRNPHRHMFGVKVEMDVFHDDREVEFIMLKHTINDWVRMRLSIDGVWAMGCLSCEQVANQIIAYLQKVHGSNRWIRVTVDEDGENGAYVETEG